MILLGSNSNLEKYTELCSMLDIAISGVIDSDYYGNTPVICGVPVIDTELNLSKYKNTHNFFCATNWHPESTPASRRNKEKRTRLINLLDQGYCVTTLIDPLARISPSATIGKGCFIDAFAMLESNTVLADYVSVHTYTQVGHHTTVGRNSVIQRHCSIASNAQFDENCYLGVAVKALKSGAKFGNNTFIHESIYIRRGTVPNEIVGLNGANTSRVYSEQQRVIDF